MLVFVKIHIFWHVMLCMSLGE